MHVLLALQERVGSMSVTYLKTFLENFQGFLQFLTLTLKQTVLTMWQTCSMFYSVVVNIFDPETHLKFFGQAYYSSSCYLGSHISSAEGHKSDVETA